MDQQPILGADADRLFDYDSADPLRIDEVSAEERGHAIVRDIRFSRGSLDEVSALLVQPLAPAPNAGVLFLHWFAPEEPDGNRRQFVDEAITLAAHGIASLLPQQVFPWSAEPVDAATDRVRLGSQLQSHRHALDVLQSNVGNEAPLGIVGHDFGGMYAAVLLNTDSRPTAAVLIAGVPRWGDWFWPFWAIEGERADYFAALAPLDPERHLARVAGIPLLFQFAERDYFVAGMAAWEFHRRAGEPKELKTYDSDHAMRSEPATADREAFLLRHIGGGARISSNTNHRP